MLSEALKELRDFVFEENGDAKSDEEITAKLEKINEEQNVPKNADINQFLFYFTELKMKMIEKGLQNEDGTFKDTGSLDWTPPEKKIMWYYLTAAQEEENMKYVPAEEALSQIIFKTTNSIRYKYFDIKSKVEKGASLSEQLNKSRGGKKNNVIEMDKSKAAGKKNRVGRPRKSDSVEEVISQETVSVSNLEETEQISTQNTVEKKVNQQAVSAKETVKETVKEAVKEVASVNTSTSDDYYTEQEIIESSPGHKLQDSVIGKHLSEMIHNLHTMTRLPADTPEIINPIDNVSIANYFIGLNKIVEYGAKYMEMIPNLKELESKVKSLEAELEKERELTMELHRTNAEREKQMSKHTEELEKTFNTLKNAHRTFLTKEDFEKYNYMEKYEENMRVHLKAMEEIIDNEKDILDNTDRKWLVDTKNGFLERKLS